MSEKKKVSSILLVIPTLKKLLRYVKMEIYIFFPCKQLVRVLKSSFWSSPFEPLFCPLMYHTQQFSRLKHGGNLEIKSIIPLFFFICQVPIMNTAPNI